MQSVWPDYRPVSWFCRTNLKGGGVAIYAKNDVKVYDINPDVDSVEQDEYCSTKIKLNDKFFIILCLYRAPNGVFTNFRDKLIDLLEIVCSQCSCVFVAGDFNVNFNGNTGEACELLNIFSDFNVNFNGNTGEACELLNIFSSFGCQRLFDQDTRIANQSHSCIDNIFCNDLSYVQSTDMNHFHVTDHLYQLLTINTTFKNDKFRTLKRTFSEHAMSEFLSMISRETWNDVYCSDCYV
ncbi:hypothetical protein QE152_g24871 [Popillia japonica]|uniref:Endonuclease/exonuclease/phosphatase domain-containing protein n=1 Tax=Popillia japonica TaxID=7064 RepID=A0AAW1K346_POPJA